jgi:hypothetical protein
LTPNPITNTPAIIQFRVMEAVMFGCEASIQLVGERLSENGQYLAFTLIDLSTTFTTKLPPVPALPVYHPRVKAMASAPTRPPFHG